MHSVIKHVLNVKLSQCTYAVSHHSVTDLHLWRKEGAYWCLARSLHIGAWQDFKIVLSYAHLEAKVVGNDIHNVMSVVGGAWDLSKRAQHLSLVAILSFKLIPLNGFPWPKIMTLNASWSYVKLFAIELKNSERFQQSHFTIHQYVSLRHEFGLDCCQYKV